MKVAIGSTNPVKIAAVRDAFKKVFPKKKFSFIGIEVKSGVSHQPMSDLETIKGAKNRAMRSRKKINSEFGIGLEGGIQKINGKWYDCGWVVVIYKDKHGIGSSIRMEVPGKMMRHVHKGMEIGLIDDMFFKQNNSKQGKGHFGLMTKGLITRKDGYSHAVIAALARFINKDLF